MDSESKSYQLRVRVTPEERDFLEKMSSERGRGETISELVREAISLLAKSKPHGSGPSVLSPQARARIESLAVLLKREPRQVEEACVEGILDLIEARCEVPLIVMETLLHLNYRSRGEKISFPWQEPDNVEATTRVSDAAADAAPDQTSL